MYLLNGNIVVRKNDGEIKVSEYENALKSNLTDFPESQKPEDNVLIFTHSNKGLIITPDQITYALKGDINDISIPNITDLLSTTNHLLELGEEARLVVNLEIISSINGNSLKKSLASNEKSATELDAIGIGQRYIVEKENINGNIFIEPYLSDETKIYIRIQFETTKEINIEEWKDEFTDIISYIEKAKGVIEDIYN